MALEKFQAPALPVPPLEYDQRYATELIRVLRLYFTRLDSLTPNQAQSYRADNFYGGFFVGGVTDAITAAGATQATATELTTAVNNVTVVASGADGVRLPIAQPGVQILVRNSDASDALKIFPASGEQINALGVDTAYSLAAGSTIQLFATTTTQWYTF